MDFGAGLKKNLVSLMGQIQDVFLLEKRGTEWFEFSKFQYEKELDKLVEVGVLELKPYPKISGTYPNDTSENMCLLKINEENFSKLYRELIGGDISPNSHSSMVLFIDNDGYFWREPKDKLCYAMEADSDRFKTLKYLIGNKGYQTTKLISDFLGGKDEKLIRNEINKIRKNIYHILGAEDLIQSKKDSGYRINPMYKIIKE
jgi:hypothetical protein